MIRYMRLALTYFKLSCMTTAAIGPRVAIFDAESGENTECIKCQVSEREMHELAFTW